LVFELKEAAVVIGEFGCPFEFPGGEVVVEVYLFVGVVSVFRFGAIGELCVAHIVFVLDEWGLFLFGCGVACCFFGETVY
jgi:hypothetical protein